MGRFEFVLKPAKGAAFIRRGNANFQSTHHLQVKLGQGASHFGVSIAKSGDDSIAKS